MMTKLRKAVEQLVQDEYNLASQQHGKYFNSSHEAYAVIKEEMEEAKYDINVVESYLNKYWNAIKSNLPSTVLCELEKIAINAACECIQVAAMAFKASVKTQEETEK